MAAAGTYVEPVVRQRSVPISQAAQAGRMIRHRDRHRRHGDEEARAHAADVLERERGVEVTVQCHRRAGAQCRGGVDVHAADVEHRYRRQNLVVGRHSKGGDRVQRVRRQCAVREYCALRSAARPRRVRDQDGSRRIEIGIRRNRDRIADVPLEPVRVKDYDAGGRKRHRADDGGVAKARFGNEETWRALLDEDAKLRRRHPRVQRDEDRADSSRRKKDLEEIRAVRAEIRDAVARLDPRLRQKAGHPSDSGLELGIGGRAPLEAKRSLGRRPARPVGDPPRDVHAAPTVQLLERTERTNAGRITSLQLRRLGLHVFAPADSC